VVKQSIIEVLPTKVSVTSSSLHCENTATDVEERNIKGSSSEIEDEDILLSLGLAVETVSDGGSSRLINDTEDIKTSDGTCVLGSETLRVVEVGGYTDKIK
jgi:hypothetical protein